MPLGDSITIGKGEIEDEARDGQDLSDNLQNILSGSPLLIHAASFTFGSVLQ